MSGLVQAVCRAYPLTPDQVRAMPLGDVRILLENGDPRG